jgi:ribonuclease HI
MHVTPATRADSPAALADALGEPGWDVLLVGDGSGAGWDLPVGWGCVLIDRASGLRKRFAGAMSAGTSYLAELYPYVHALSWLAARRKRKAEVLPLRVVVVTDSQAVVAHARKLRGGELSLGELGEAAGAWAALLAFDRACGLLLSFRWAARETTALNCWADAAGRGAYRAAQALAWPAAAGGREVSPYECNPAVPRAHDLAGVPVKPLRRRRKGRPRGKDCPPADGDE